MDQCIDSLEKKTRLSLGGNGIVNNTAIKLSELSENKDTLLAEEELRLVGEVSFTIYENVEDNGCWLLDRQLKNEMSVFDTFRKTFN